MDVKGAVKKAVEYVSDVFQSENLENVGLEEVFLNDADNVWEITVGFSRPWDYPKQGIVTGLQPQNPRRQYKVVSVDADSGEIKSIKIRALPNE
ncbi:hypothetical protein LZ24_02213 [Desulfobotulus alkaliphilus]|uniref:PepSY domain-containing protein n=1 Tax=Desulfobotulus alkaliphilus TaxID=622671 RepID=A0A562RNZ0_9BACT|nr:hypothetical protein [Desulfobotulus alkaliphilus]TWI70792.1 hypothetical protein LZ24_02213 [Desulfobotulus alkaliphilus]